MLNFWNSILGILMIIVGILVFVWLTNKRIKGDKGGYGAHINIYTGAIILFFVGLIMLLGELTKL